MALVLNRQGQRSCRRWQKIISAPACFTLSIAATISSVLSIYDFMGYLLSPNSTQRSSMIGVKASLIRPSNTSGAGSNDAIVLRTNGFTLSGMTISDFLRILYLLFL